MDHSPQRSARGAVDEDELVRAHLPLVNYAVAELRSRIPAHVCRDDLVSAAMYGLCRAARSFDESRGIAFDKYAAIRIRGALLDELRSRDWATRSVRNSASRLRSATEDLTSRLGRQPTTAELGDELGVDALQVHTLLDDVHRATLLNYEAVFAEGDPDALLAADDEDPEEAVLRRERQGYLVDAVEALPDNLRRVVVGYFFEERPMEDIARELGVSESRISQLRSEALRRLRDGINSQLEPETLAAEPPQSPLIARRRAAYYAAIASASDHRTRMSTDTAEISRRLLGGRACNTTARGTRSA